MTTMIHKLEVVASEFLPVLIDSAIKGAVVLILVIIALLFMKRASAATRHLVVALGMASLLMLPVLSTLLPAWQVLPRWWNFSGVESSALASLHHSTSPLDPDQAWFARSSKTTNEKMPSLQ